MFSTFHHTIICLLQLAIYCCVYWHGEIRRGNKPVICCAGERGGAVFWELVAFPGWLVCASPMGLTWQPPLGAKTGEEVLILTASRHFGKLGENQPTDPNFR